MTFEEDKKERLALSDFSFLETQDLLKDFKGSFSDEVIEERRNALWMFQLASALKVKSKIDLFLTSDNLLSEISQIEGLTIK